MNDYKIDAIFVYIKEKLETNKFFNVSCILSIQLHINVPNYFVMIHHVF